MNLKCYVCSRIFTQCKILFYHIKNVHTLATNDLFQCGFSNCNQTFPIFKAFKKHMQNESKRYCTTNNSVSISNSNETSSNTCTAIVPPQQNCEIFRSDSNNTFSVPDISIEEGYLKFSLHHFCKKKIPRRETIQLQREVTSLIINPIRAKIINILNHFDSKNLPDLKASLQDLASCCNDPFKDINSEYKLIKTLKELDLYAAPKIIQIDNSVRSLQIKHVAKLDATVAKGVLFQIKFHIKKFFEIPGVYESFEENMKSLAIDNTSLNNFINGKTWRNKINRYPEKCLIPYLLYFDDFEVNNPLDSHSSSLLATYYSFPTAPINIRHKLASIFIAALFKSQDVKSFGNAKTFFKLIEVLNDLKENGIDIKTSNGTKTIFPCLGLVAGDNLALNNILEEFDKLRNKLNYEQDIVQNDFGNTGITKNSIFNKIRNFHVTENYYVDILHDILEGVLKYGFCNIILHYINQKTFDLEFLNLRKQNFDYGETENGNKSPSLQLHHIKSFNLKLSGREMLTFAHFFTLIIGDVVERDDIVWKFVLNLIELLDLLLLSEYTSLDMINLKSHIQTHNRDYPIIFYDTLKPKHHLLIHYCRVLEHSGPLKLLWTLPFESKHRQLKEYAKNITSRKNLTLSLAIKFAIVFSENVTNFENIEILLGKKIGLLQYSLYWTHLQSMFNNETLEGCVCYLSFKRYNTLYKRNFIIFFYDPNFSAYQILEIFTKDNKTFMFCEKNSILTYNAHFLSYEVGGKSSEFKLFNADNLKNPPIHLYTVQNRLFLRPKQFF
ncbi:uncharacterized protein [Eurosta solidaginis]|uniref:uncharacterized protein n=1 Tax=Eurosta solidaginis TaxID=178769 RepID=UPI0035312CD7